MSIAIVLLATGAMLAMLTVTWQGRREAMARLALGGTGSARQGTHIQGEALFATGVDRSTVAFDCLLSVGPATAGALEPLSLTLWRPMPSWSSQSLADIVRSWADGGERVFVELELDSTHGPFSTRPLMARLSCGQQGLQAEVADRRELRPLLGGRSSPLAWPR